MTPFSSVSQISKGSFSGINNHFVKGHSVPSVAFLEVSPPDWGLGHDSHTLRLISLMLWFGSSWGFGFQRLPSVSLAYALTGLTQVLLLALSPPWASPPAHCSLPTTCICFLVPLIIPIGTHILTQAWLPESPPQLPGQPPSLFPTTLREAFLDTFPLISPLLCPSSGQPTWPRLQEEHSLAFLLRKFPLRIHSAPSRPGNK